MAPVPTSGDAPSTLCAVCGRPERRKALVPAIAIRPRVAALLERRAGDRWSADARVCRPCLDEARVAFAAAQLELDRGELDHIERQVARQAARHEVIAAQVDEELAKTTTAGQRIADSVARVGGSWAFVIGFSLVLVGWMVVNAWWLRAGAFDPYPFILLNLLLSSLAALQAPVIMMAQNRSATRDRLQADLDYRVNLKAELEVASLHDKLDHLLHAQFDRLVEMQQIQIDLLTERTSDSRDSRG